MGQFRRWFRLTHLLLFLIDVVGFFSALSLLFRCSLAALLYGNCTGIARELYGNCTGIVREGLLLVRREIGGEGGEGTGKEGEGNGVRAGRERGVSEVREGRERGVCHKTILYDTIFLAYVKKKH